MGFKKQDKTSTGVPPLAIPQVWTAKDGQFDPVGPGVDVKSALRTAKTGLQHHDRPHQKLHFFRYPLFRHTFLGLRSQKANITYPWPQFSEDSLDVWRSI